jgi:hypothetical protein
MHFIAGREEIESGASPIQKGKKTNELAVSAGLVGAPLRAERKLHKVNT